MAYGKYKDLTKTESDKVLGDKVFKIANNRKYDGYQGGLASTVFNFFDKKSTGSGQINNLKINFLNQLLRNFKKEEFI